MDSQTTNASPANIRRLDHLVAEAANDAAVAPSPADFGPLHRRFLPEGLAVTLEIADNN